MSIPTYQNVWDSTRSLLGDDQVSGGEIFTNTLLSPYTSVAVRELFRALQTLQIPTVNRIVYYTLPAYTTVLFPITMNVTDMSAPTLLEERAKGTEFILTGATINSSVPSVTWTTASTSPLQNGNFVTINGASGLSGSDGFWGIANVTPTTFDTLGMVAAGTFSGAPVAQVNPNQWTEVVQTGSAENQWVNTNLRSTLGEYYYYNEVFHFPPCSATQQIRLSYEADGTPSATSTASIGVEDSLNFLAARTAGLAIAARGNVNEAQRLNQMALGPAVDTAIWAGFLGELMLPMVRTVQNRPPQLRRKPPFRQPRSTTPSIW